MSLAQAGDLQGPLPVSWSALTKLAYLQLHSNPGINGKDVLSIFLFVVIVLRITIHPSAARRVNCANDRLSCLLWKREGK
jgi:hypothetical protein